MASSIRITRVLVVAFTFIVISLNNLALATIPRPRGVSISRTSLYYPEKGNTWHCLDGSKKIKFSQINDDYCDCKDGSDEPGTAACDNTVYHCENIGYRGEDIPTTRVDDHVCDCCDGSDEAGTVQCPNTCNELGRLQFEKQQYEAEILRTGLRKRAELIKKGNQMKAERVTRRIELERRRTETNAIKEEREMIKKEAERAEAEALEFYKEISIETHATPTDTQKKKEHNKAMLAEAEAAFTRLDTNKDGFVEITELQVDMSLDQDRNGVVTVEEAKYFLDERDRIDFENFFYLSWPRIKPMRMVAEGLFQPPRDEEITEEHAELLTEGEGIAHAHQDTRENYEPEEEEEEVYEEEEPDTGMGSAIPENRIPVSYDPETQRLIDLANEARNAIAETENQLREIESALKEIDDIARRDYGPEEEYAYLDGQCFNFDDREYVYTFCPFNRATQKQKSGGAETTLGRWEEWIEEGDNKYSKQRYSHGAACWNGPHRSVVIKFKCQTENRLISVAEPNRCEYYFEFETPTACVEAPKRNRREDHDEL